MRDERQGILITNGVESIIKNVFDHAIDYLQLGRLASTLELSTSSGSPFFDRFGRYFLRLFVVLSASLVGHTSESVKQ